MANAARGDFDKDGLITVYAGENETLDLPQGSIAELVTASYECCDEDNSASLDVLKRIEKDVLQGHPIKVNNSTMGGDPKPGKRKVLRLRYKPSSTLVTITADEGKDLVLPPHAAEGIRSAKYGHGSEVTDVLISLQATLLSNPAQKVVVNNELLGGDPCPGKRKTLTVSYDPSRTRQSFKLHTSRELATFGLVSPWLFRDLCKTIGLDLQAFYSSLTDHELTGGVKQDSGKSGQIFWFTQDRRFVLKTISDSEIATLVQMLPEYTAYLGANPDSLLTRYVGAFCLEDNGVVTQFVVMNNIFEGAPSLDVMYDLKGTTEDRWVDPEPGKCLKDNNFAETTLYFVDDDAAGIHSCISEDTKFLERQGIMDYSLMVAIARDGGAFRRQRPAFSKYMGGLHGAEATGVTADSVCEASIWIGMVDMLVQYGWKKVAAHMFKSSTIGLTEEIDTVSPDRYASRFRSYFGQKVRGRSEKCVVSTAPADPFLTPLPALGRSGGTAAFFRASYREGATDPEARISRDYYIAKDLSRAKDEVTFYEFSKQIANMPGYEILRWMTPYRGVVRCPCEVEEGKPPKPVDVMIIRNGRDGYVNCRMLDIKIGQVTAVAGWQGKSAFKAWMQSNTIDAHTNSAGQGFRLEGFDNPPETLRSFEELLTDQSLIGATVKPQKVKRFNLQRMTACQFMSLFLDVHQVQAVSRKSGGGSAYPSSASGAKASPAPVPYPEPGLLCRLETAELVLLSCIEELAGLVAACRAVPVPQQWIGSSVMLCFDSGSRPSRGVLERGPGKWGVSRTHIFDWGRSELNVAAAHTRLEAEKQAEREKYWGFYCGAIAKLLFDCCSLYVARYWHPKKSIALTVWDKDQFTPDDFVGTVALPVPAPGGCLSDKYGLHNYDGSAVTSGFLRGTSATLAASVKPFPLMPLSRFQHAYTVTVHKAENLPSKDTMSPNDSFVEVVGFPEDPKVVLEGCKRPEVQNLLRMGAHLTSLQIDQQVPRWDEEFEIGALSEEAKRPFLRALGVAIGFEEGTQVEELVGLVACYFHSSVHDALPEAKATQSRTDFLKRCFPTVEVGRSYTRSSVTSVGTNRSRG